MSGLSSPNRRWPTSGASRTHPGRSPGHLLLGRTSQLVQSLGRNDRFFPVEWLQTLIRDRLRIVPDEIDSGHCPALSRPHELAELLDGYRTPEDPQ
jgi:hypothetical protein